AAFGAADGRGAAHARRRVFAPIRERRRIASAHRTQQLLRLPVQLLEVGPDRKTTSGHDEPPFVAARGPLASGEKEDRAIVRSRGLGRWTRSFPRTGGVLHAGARKLPPQRMPSIGRTAPGARRT